MSQHVLNHFLVLLVPIVFSILTRRKYFWYFGSFDLYDNLSRAVFYLLKQLIGYMLVTKPVNRCTFLKELF